MTARVLCESWTAFGLRCAGGSEKRKCILFSKLLLPRTESQLLQLTLSWEGRHSMGLARLLLLSGLMLVATTLSAFAPLFFKFSPRRLAFISTFSQGLLIGAALSVVIPEGVEAVYSNAVPASHQHDSGSEEHHEHSSSAGYIGVALLTGFILMYALSLPSG